MDEATVAGLKALGPRSFRPTSGQRRTSAAMVARARRWRRLVLAGPLLVLAGSVSSLVAAATEWRVLAVVGGVCGMAAVVCLVVAYRATP